MFCERRHMKSCEGFRFWFVVSRSFLNCFFKVFVWIVVTCWGVLVLLHVFIWCRVGCGSGRVLIMCLYFLLVFAKANLWSRSGCAISLMYGFFIAWVRLFMKDVNDLDTLFYFCKSAFWNFCRLHLYKGFLSCIFDIGDYGLRQGHYLISWFIMRSFFC